jgi:hypothetical protein
MGRLRRTGGVNVETTPMRLMVVENIRSVSGVAYLVCPEMLRGFMSSA